LFELATNRDRLAKATEIEELTTQRYQAIHRHAEWPLTTAGPL
jgi:hypothetical protein